MSEDRLALKIAAILIGVVMLICILFGFTVFTSAKTIFHEIAGLLIYLIAATLSIPFILIWIATIKRG